MTDLILTAFFLLLCLVTTTIATYNTRIINRYSRLEAYRNSPLAKIMTLLIVKVIMREMVRVFGDGKSNKAKENS